MTRQSGFSLMELILVMLILSLLATGFSRLIANQSLQYVERNRQQDLAYASRLALERMVRELREALPGSIRLAGAAGTSQCLEFMPILAGSFYLQQVAGASVSRLTLVDFTPDASSKYLVIYPVSTADLYASSSRSLAAIASIGAMQDAGNNDKTRQVLLVSAMSFAQDSPRRRAYLLADPVSFCVNAQGELRRHQNYGRLTVAALNPNTGQLLAQGLSLQSAIFSYLPASLQRNALVRMDLTLQQVDTSLQLSHSLQLRNLP